MENSKFRSENVLLKDLSLWDENARFPDKYFNKSESELVEFFLSKKDFKVAELTEAIVKDFGLPQLEKLIVYDDGTKLTVLEGNRRLTVYKLLTTPSLVGNNSALRRFFEENKSKINITENFPIECLITDDKEIGYRYIDRKHAHGNHEVNWGDTERAHYNKRRGKAKWDERLKIALAKTIKDIELPEIVKEQILGHGFVTTFYRIVTSGPATKLFGFDLTADDELKYSDPCFTDKLKVIIWNVLQQQDFSGKKINSRSLNKNEEIEKYLKSITNDYATKVDSEIGERKHTNLLGEERIAMSKKISTRASPKSTSRNYLIPKTFNILIHEPKINNIYRELRDDLLLDDSSKSVPNAVGVMFRVFLELSIDYLLDKEGQTPSAKDTISTKIPKIVSILKKNGIAIDKQLKAINKVVSTSNSTSNKDFLSIENFHQYVHSYKEQPTPSSLKLKWDNLQEFFELLWGYINSKSNTKKQP